MEVEHTNLLSWGQFGIILSVISVVMNAVILLRVTILSRNSKD